MKTRTSLRTQLAYAGGSLGAFILFYLINFYLVLFYLPPVGQNAAVLIPETGWLGVLSPMAVVIFLSRAVHIGTDLGTAALSDRWRGASGRRIPFLKAGSLAAVICIFSFFPPDPHASLLNGIYLLVQQILFFTLFSVYTIPHNALMVDISACDADRINLATWVGVGESAAIVIASQGFVLWSVLEQRDVQAMAARQTAFTGLCAVAFVLMLLPALLIREKAAGSRPKAVYPFRQSFVRVMQNPLMIPFAASILLYSVGLNLLLTGIPYFLLVFLELEARYFSMLIPLMILTSLVSYPLSNLMMKRVGRKKVVILGYLSMILFFFFMVLAGFRVLDLFLPRVYQGGLMFLLVGFPAGFLSVAIPAVCADIAAHARKVRGQAFEGMYFAARSMMVKTGAALGIGLFVCLTALGKDPGDDLGLKISILAGLGAVVLAALVFSVYYREDQLTQRSLTHERGGSIPFETTDNCTTGAGTGRDGSRNP